ncbi:Ig-like domain-containing protein [Solirubrobacter taibaiensis]|nr:Ig-like domain-containing protein [Solirubrobacter taibaiensis]
MRAVVLCVVFLALPSSAHAATLVKSGSTLTYTAAPGRASTVTFSVPDPGQPGSVRVARATDGDPIQATGCAPAGQDFTCTGIERIVADLGDGNDVAEADAFGGPVVFAGGPGADRLDGGAGPDVLDGGDGDDVLDGGAGNDTVSGSAGDDALNGGTGADALSGGAGLDDATHVMLAPTPAAGVSLDDVANDGLPGEGDNYASDIEDVSILGQGIVVPSGSTLIGSAGPNELVTGPGNDTINAGAGIDRVTADAGDDAIDVRDGFSDRVRCGPGTDTVVADTLDQIGADCETVNVADAGNALDDRPPTIAWAFPKANARLKADPSNPLTVTAADDRGIAMVRFLDDDEVICEVIAPPYTCGYRANTGDVGRNTLSAVAVDTAGQTTTIQRAVTVNRFRPPLKITIERGFRITGRLESAGAGCRGTVTVRAVVGKRTLATRKLKLSSRCTYKTTIKLARRSGLRFRANFGGNSLVMARAVSKAAPR